MKCHAERIALRFMDQAWTYAELDRISAALAAGLRASGARCGDRIGLLLPNGPELVWLYLACIRLGAIAVPLNIRLTGRELAHNLNHCGARLCIAQRSLCRLLEPIRQEMRSIEKIFVVQSGGPLPGGEPYETLLVGSSKAEWATLALDTPAAILYTSGSTAFPKGVLHTQRSLGATVRYYVEAVGLGESDVVLGMLSMAHIFGFTLQWLAPLGAGATVVVTPSFDPEAVLELIEAHRVTHLYGLPIMFDNLTRSAAARRAACVSLRYCLAGGDAVSSALSERMREVLGVDLHEGCGMTEVIPYCLNRPGAENRVGTIGPPSVGMQVRLADTAGADVAERGIGEILVKSDALMDGYWQDPQATQEVLTDGWFHTGDLGQQDSAGYYRFVGRSKQIIVRGGSNISPLEVEAVLARHPSIREAAVVGKPDAALGETVAAFVVAKPSAVPDADELLRFAATRLAAYKMPESVFFLDELPRGSTGKVQRKLLRDWLTLSAGDEGAPSDMWDFLSMLHEKYVVSDLEGKRDRPLGRDGCHGRPESVHR